MVLPFLPIHVKDPDARHMLGACDKVNIVLLQVMMQQELAER